MMFFKCQLTEITQLNQDGSCFVEGKPIMTGFIQEICQTFHASKEHDGKTKMITFHYKTAYQRTKGNFVKEASKKFNPKHLKLK